MFSQKPVLGYLELLCSQSPVNRKDSNVLQLVDVFNGVTARRGTCSMTRARHGWPGGGARKSRPGEGLASKKEREVLKLDSEKWLFLLKYGPRPGINISLKEKYKWPMGTWENAQSH